MYKIQDIKQQDHIAYLISQVTNMLNYEMLR